MRKTKKILAGILTGSDVNEPCNSMGWSKYHR